jgi:hypothetical protein
MYHRIVGAASLPGSSRQGGPNGFYQSLVVVGDDQLDTGETSSGQRTPEDQPAGPVLGGGQLQSQDLSVAVAVYADTRRRATLTTRPPSRTLRKRASAHRDRRTGGRG